MTITIFCYVQKTVCELCSQNDWREIKAWNSKLSQTSVLTVNKRRPCRTPGCKQSQAWELEKSTEMHSPSDWNRDKTRWDWSHCHKVIRQECWSLHAICKCWKASWIWTKQHWAARWSQSSRLLWSLSAHGLFPWDSFLHLRQQDQSPVFAGLCMLEKTAYGYFSSPWEWCKRSNFPAKDSLLPYFTLWSDRLFLFWDLLLSSKYITLLLTKPAPEWYLCGH